MTGYGIAKKSNTHHRIVKMHIKFLANCGLMVATGMHTNNRGELYATTPKGAEFVKAYQQMVKLLK
jgi:predicted transcriptional regulator